MYPGYSPADHEYGKAAEEYGKAAAEARAKGLELKHPEAEYEIGQGKGVRRKKLAGIQGAQATKGTTSVSGNGSGTGSGSEGPIKPNPKEPTTTNGQASAEKVQEATPGGENPYFVIDTKPMPVNIPGMSFKSQKRSASPDDVEAKKHKKAKEKHEGDMPKGEDTREAKTEDISERVDARMKEKREKRRMKEEKKRKRETEGKPAAAAEAPQAAAEPSAAAAEVGSPKKKKAKTSGEERLPDRAASKKRPGEDDGEREDGEGRRKKKRKKSKETAVAQDA